MSFAAHRARKRFGQHWLTDQSVLRQILEAAELNANDTVLEVGPGRGALTEQLLASPAAAVRAVELDRDLVVGLRERFGADSRFELTEGDVLAVELPEASTVCPVPPRCFQPPPKVMSEVVALDPLPADQRLDPALARTVEMLLRRCFAARRKMLRNTLSGLMPAEALQAWVEAAEVALQQRPQEVSPAHWVRLAAGLNQLNA